MTGRMQTLLKTLLAIGLGLGFMALDVHAKPSLAFLGLGSDSDPRVSQSIAQGIQWELAGDTALFAYPGNEIALLFAKGVLRDPEAGPLDMPRLSKALGAQYYAFGTLEPIAMQSKRILWMPWSIRVKWTQGMRLRVVDGATGSVIYDGLVTAEVPEKASFSAPESRLGNLSPLDRESRLRIMAAAVSAESARTLSKVVREKAAPAAQGAKPEPQGG